MFTVILEIVVRKAKTRKLRDLAAGTAQGRAFQAEEYVCLVPLRNSSQCSCS